MLAVAMAASVGRTLVRRPPGLQASRTLRAVMAAGAPLPTAFQTGQTPRASRLAVMAAGAPLPTAFQTGQTPRLLQDPPALQPVGAPRVWVPPKLQELCPRLEMALMAVGAALPYPTDLEPGQPGQTSCS